MCFIAYKFSFSYVREGLCVSSFTAHTVSDCLYLRCFVSLMIITELSNVLERMDDLLRAPAPIVLYGHG